MTPDDFSLFGEPVSDGREYGGGHGVSRRTRKSVKASCDRLWSQLVKTRANWKCERCGAEPENPQAFHAHHVYGRSNHRLRFEPRNGVALCWLDHRWAEETPLEFSEWMWGYDPESVQFLQDENAKGIIKRDLHDYLELEAELRVLLDKASDEYGTDRTA